MAGTAYPAVLLLGPTGAGKTPLGQWIERHGWAGQRCVHFDFGENLRKAVRQELPPDCVSPPDIYFLRGVLERGVLLEDQDFPIAERILLGFLAQRQADHRTRVILNGLPRHTGQAAAMQHLVAVRTVVCLDCDAPTVLLRIQHDPGGDRAERVDDQLAAVRKKLSIYDQRTTPLVDWYRQRGASILRIEVSAQMTAAQMWQQVQQAACLHPGALQPEVLARE